MYIMDLVLKYKELSYILSTISTFLSRLYHVGVISLVYCMYLCISGVILRASYIYFDSRMNEMGYYVMLVEYYIYISSNSDCMDRYIIRINESLNSVYIMYYLCYVCWMCSGIGCIMGGVYDIMYYVILWYVCGLVDVGVLGDRRSRQYNSLIKYFIESSKGVYVLFMLLLFSLYLYNGVRSGNVRISGGIDYCIGCMLSDYVMMNRMNSYCRVYNVGDVVAVLGSVDFVLGSVDG